MNKPQNMLTVGLTGGIGSGKTTVSNLFKKLGTSIIDTDIIAREIVSINSSVLDDIVDTFGQDVLDQGRHLDRKKLASIVFNNTEKKQRLENILHPNIRSEVNRQIKLLQSADPAPRYVIVVVPLLFETNFGDLTDRVIAVLADDKTRVNRILERDNRDVEEIRSIINSQVSDEKRTSEADDIINNNHDLKQLETQVQLLHNKYIQLSIAAM